MKFKIEGTFEADDIDHAFEVLGKHFNGLSKEGIDYEDDIGLCEFNVYPVEEPE